MNCLVVGAGAIAGDYATQLEERSLSIAGVCDLEIERATALGERYDAPSFPDLDAALARVDAPLVVNLTSHAAHAPVTRAALRADRHVYSQKPLALDEETAADLVALARERDLALGCAPETPRAPSQRRARRLRAEGRLGRVRLGYAHAHVGRVTEWHDRPDSFLAVGPLYDGGVYPLALLVSWLGPVQRVRVADALDVWPDRLSPRPEAPSHVEATLSFESGPTVRLTASFYAPHRSREFYGLELFGDDGSLYLRNSGAMGPAPESVRFARSGRGYTTVPPQFPVRPATYVDPVERLARSVLAGSPTRQTGRRGAHLVAVCNGIETAVAEGGPVEVDDFGVEAEPMPEPSVSAANRTAATSTRQSLRLPPIGFGCSRYRDGEYVDRRDSIATAVDAGYRLFDSAELYGNESRIGDLLAAPGSPDRDHLFVAGKVWRTNHRQDHLLTACEGSLAELGIDSFDCYMLHWPEAWAHRGHLTRLAEEAVERQEALTVPEADDGTVETADVSLETAWNNLEAVFDRGWAQTLGVCNVSLEQLETVCEAGAVSPAIVQVERHPYAPRTDLVSWCHDRGIRVVAHSPLSADGLLEEPVLAAVGQRHDLSPAGVVVAWNVTRGVVPIPSSTNRAHVVSNLAAASVRLSDRECARIESLRTADRDR